MDQNLQLQYFHIPASEQGSKKDLIGVLDCSGSMGGVWKYVAKCFNDLKGHFVNSSAITFDTSVTVVPSGDQILQNIGAYGGGGTNITIAFMKLNEEIQRLKIKKDVIILFVSDGQGDYDEAKIKSTMTEVENLDFVCLGVGSNFPTHISMSLRKLYHSGDLAIPPLFVIDIGYGQNVENNFIEQFGLIQQNLKFIRQQVQVSPCFQFPWDEQQTNTVWGSSWVSSYTQTLQYETNSLLPEFITINQIIQIGNYWLQNINLLSLQRKVVKEAEVAFAELERLRSLLNQGETQTKPGKKSFAQRIKSQKKDDVDEYEAILEQLKEFKKSFTLQQLNDQDAADRLKIGSKVGKFHKKALKFAGLTTEDYLKAKNEFIQCLKEHKFQGEDGERSIMTLQSQKEILQEQDLIEGLQLCDSQYALVTQFPIIGYGLQIKRSNASMIDPFRVEIVSLVRIHKYLDSVSLIEAPDHVIKFKAGNNDEEIVNCILPLYRKEHQDLIPFFRSLLFHTVMTFVVCENADVCFDYAYSALLANTFYYLIQQPESEWRNEMIALVTESYYLAYGQKNQYFHKKLVQNPIQTLVDVNETFNTMCQDTIKALLPLNLVKDTLNQEQIKLIVDRIIIESIGRALHELPAKDFTNLFINQTNEKEILENLSQQIIETYDVDTLKTFKSMSAITGNIKNQVEELPYNKFNIVLSFNQDNVIKVLNQSKYKYNALQALYEFYFKAEIPLNFFIFSVFHARHTKSPERANNQVIEDMGGVNDQIIQLKFGQLKSELLEVCKVNIRGQVQKLGISNMFVQRMPGFGISRRRRRRPNVNKQKK